MNRQRWNQRLFPEAPGTDHAKERWTARLGKQRVRRNAVLAVEVFMGMSDGTAMPYKKQLEWFKDNRAWLAKIFGEDNIIGGSLNLDEKTPHFHGFIIPIDKKGKLNCRDYLGEKGKLRDLQDSYAEAMKSHGLQRGIKGSKRKHIPQRTLYEWRNQVQRRVTEIQATMDAQIAELQNTNTLALLWNPKTAIAKCLEIVENAKKEIADLGEAAKDVLLVKRDAQEREQLVREKEEALVQCAKEKQRADAVLKEHAAMVRGMDLAPIASEILAVAPVENEGTYVLADQSFHMEITGRKFRDTKRAEIKGSGAIDLVSKLTGKNFKQAVEFLLSKHSAPEIVADEAGKVAEGKTQEITDCKPRIFSLDDIPKHIYVPNDTAWIHLRDHLCAKRHFDADFLNRLHENKLLWAVNSTTLAVHRYHPDAPETPIGVTMLDLSDLQRPPRIFVPDSHGYFWAGCAPADAQAVALVRNPLEALSYRYLMALNDGEDKRQNITNPARVSTIHVVSLDSTTPPNWLWQSILAKKKKLILATNPADVQRDVERIFGPVTETPEFINSFVYETPRNDIPKILAPHAWNQSIPTRIEEIERQKILEKTRIKQ